MLKKKKPDWLIYSPIVLFSYPITSNTSTISSCGRASSSPIPSIAGSINNRNVPNVEVICKKVGLEPDRSWVHLKIKSVWLKSITSCKLFLKNHIIQLIYSVLNKSTINKREISTGINHIFNLFWSPVLVESSCMKLRNKKKNRKILQSLIIVTTCWGGIGVSSVKWQMFWKTYQSSPHPASQDHDHR